MYILITIIILAAVLFMSFACYKYGVSVGKLKEQERSEEDINEIMELLENALKLNDELIGELNEKLRKS